MLSTLNRLRAYPGLLRDIQAYFERSPTLAEAKATVRRHVETRDELFLRVAQDRYYAPDSPYRPLLDLAQCGYRDLEIMVRQRGLEPALEALRRAGVYLSFEEFKFGGEVRRDGRVFRFNPAQFTSREGTNLIIARSGATRSSGTWGWRSIEHLASRTPLFAVMLDIFAAGEAPIFIWQSGFPAGGAIFTWFVLGGLHRPAARWFSLTPVPTGIRARHRFIFHTIQVAARRAGLRLPVPEFVPVGAAGTVLDAVAEALRTSGRCVVLTSPSCAVRLAVEARRRATTLDGVQFIANGEPLTPGKAEEIRRAGARVAARYSMNEVGPVALPCGAAIEPDDMHFLTGRLAMIPSPRQIGDVTTDALMLTSLLPTAPKLLLNVEVDDFATVEKRQCGCPWDELGYGTHVRDVRSFTKLTGEGTTLLGSNCVDILERVLPGAFGGSSVDYQLVEAEDHDHLTRLYLLISPRIGKLDDAAVLRRFGEALRATSGRPLGGRRTIWEQAHTIRIVRHDPMATAIGKLLPFHTLGTLGTRRPFLPAPGAFAT